MPGFRRELAEHSLNVYHDVKTIKKTIRCFGHERRPDIGKEIAWLSKLPASSKSHTY
jgi:hypothetical protein